MEFTIEKVEKGYVVKEEGRIIFSSDYEIDEKLISLYLRNIYGDEAVGIYQIKKWYTPLKPALALDFTIYEGDVKMGELHKIKGGFAFDYQGVSYRFYSGIFASKRRVICFDRTHQVAEMVLDEISTLHFTNSTLGALMSVLCILLKEFTPPERFSQDIFLSKYEESYCYQS